MINKGTHIAYIGQSGHYKQDAVILY